MKHKRGEKSKSYFFVETKMTSETLHIAGNPFTSDEKSLAVSTEQKNLTDNMMAGLMSQKSSWNFVKNGNKAFTSFFSSSFPIAKLNIITLN